MGKFRTAVSIFKNGRFIPATTPELMKEANVISKFCLQSDVAEAEAELKAELGLVANRKGAILDRRGNPTGQWYVSYNSDAPQELTPEQIKAHVGFLQPKPAQS